MLERYWQAPEGTKRHSFALTFGVHRFSWPFLTKVGTSNKWASFIYLFAHCNPALQSPVHCCPLCGCTWEGLAHFLDCPYIPTWPAPTAEVSVLKLMPWLR